MRLLFITVLCVFSLTYSFADNIFDDMVLESKIETAYTNIYALQFTDALQNIAELKKNYPDSPWPYIIASNYHWWMYVSGENGSKTVNLYYYNVQMAEKYISSEKTPQNTFCKLAVFSYLSRFEMMQKDYFSVLNRMKSYSGELLNSLGKEEQYPPYSLTSGLYYYLIQSLHDDYILLRPLLLLFPKGDKEKGIDLLKKTAANKKNLLSTEGKYFLAKIYADSEKNYYAAFYYMYQLTKQYPKNFIFAYYYQLYASHIKKEIDVTTEEQEMNPQLTAKQLEYKRFLLQSL